jgi:glucose-1-phosphate adenylyltransferase
MDQTIIGADARLRRVIVDRYNVIEDAAAIGFDPLRDAQRYNLDPSGIVLLPRGQTRYTS